MTDIGLIIASEPLPHGWTGLPALAADVEASGLDALWFADHLLWHRATPDPLTATAISASATDRIRLGPMVLQLPMRQTASVAKTIGFVNHLSDGRIVLGVGVGEHRWEYEAVGVGERFGRRGRLLDQAIIDLRRHWTSAHEPAMAPVRPAPIWVGGRSSAARRRAAALGDVWIPHFCHVRWFRRQVPRFLDEAARSGRRTEVRAAVSVLVHVDGIEPDHDPLAWAGGLYAFDPAAFAPVLVRGSGDQVADRLRAFLDAGASHLALLPATDRPLAHVEAIAEALRR